MGQFEKQKNNSKFNKYFCFSLHKRHKLCHEIHYEPEKIKIKIKIIMIMIVFTNTPIDTLCNSGLFLMLKL